LSGCRLSVSLNDANFQKAAPASDPSIHVVRLNFRFTLNLRDVEKMPAQRGIEVCYGTIRCWTANFAPRIAANLRRSKAPPSPRCHLGEIG